MSGTGQMLSSAAAYEARICELEAALLDSERDAEEWRVATVSLRVALARTGDGLAATIAERDEAVELLRSQAMWPQFDNRIEAFLARIGSK